MKVRRDEPVVHPRPELLRAAKWRAARYGIGADLIDVEAGCAVPAGELLEKRLAYLRASLEEEGEWEEFSSLVRATLGRGTGAWRQREVFTRTGRYEEVVDFIIRETAKGTTRE